jgi:hypothetical protein
MRLTLSMMRAAAIVPPPIPAQAPPPPARLNGARLNRMALTGGLRPVTTVPAIPTTEETLRMVHLGPSWDAFLVSGQQANFEADVSALVGFKGTPQWDVYKTWNLDVFDYLNTWSDTAASYAVYQNDSDAAPLYNPFASNERRAMDLRSQTFRDGFVADCLAVMADGGAGMFFDDVNIGSGRMFKRADGSNPIMDLDASSYYNGAGGVGWFGLLGDFYEYVITTVRATYPNAKFIANPVWTDNSGARWTDARWTNLFSAGFDWVCIEHGAGDTGLTNGATSTSGFALRSQNTYIDELHALGVGVMIYADSTSADTRRYEMARYLDKRDPALQDMIGIWEEHVRWPAYDTVFDTDLGTRLTRTDTDIAGEEITAMFDLGSIAYTPVTFSSAEVTVGGGAGGLDPAPAIFDFDDVLPFGGSDHYSKYDAVITGSTDNPPREFASIVNDPAGVIDPKTAAVRKVIKMTTPDNARQYTDTGARCQLEIFPMLNTGQEIWEGMALYFPSDFPKRGAATKAHVIHGAFGTGSTGNSPLRIDLINHGTNSDGSSGHMIQMMRASEYAFEVPWYYRENGAEKTIWDSRGYWIDIILHYRMGAWNTTSPDSGGWIEIYTNVGDGWERQPFSAASAYHGRSADTFRMYYATVDPGRAGTTPYDVRIANYYIYGAYLAWGFPDPDTGPTLYHGVHKLGDAAAQVNPRSHADQTGFPGGTEPAPQPGGTLYIQSTWESTVLDNWLVTTETTPAGGTNVSRQSTIKRDGTWAGRATAVLSAAGGSGITNPRAEWSQLGPDPLSRYTEGEEYWYGHSIYWASNFPTNLTGAAHVAVTQFHTNNRGLGGTGPAFEINNHRDDFATPYPTILRTTASSEMTLVRSEWHDFVWHIKWSANSSIGFIEVWMKRPTGYPTWTQIVPKTFRSSLTGSNDWGYWKCGVYKGFRDTNDCTTYHDAYKVGDSFGAVAHA